MADPLSVVGVIGVASQIIPTVARLGLDWKNAPADIANFKSELTQLLSTLYETHFNLEQHDNFRAAFEGRTSPLSSSERGLSSTDIRPILETCHTQLRQLVTEISSNPNNRRPGWNRMKSAFLVRRRREAIQDLQRRCQNLNNLISLNVTAAGLGELAQIRARHDDQDRQAILDWITPHDNSDRKNDLLERRQSGTGNWFLNLPEVTAWLEGQAEGPSRVLLCTGDLGVGKSTMASIVIQELEQRIEKDEGIMVAYLYCQYNQAKDQKALDLFGLILKHLIRSQTRVPANLESMYEVHRKRGTRPALDDIQTAIKEIIIAQQSRVYLVVDALDEYARPVSNTNDFLTRLSALQAETHMRLLMTSRPVVHVTSLFTETPTIEIRAAVKDMEKYVEGCFPSFHPAKGDQNLLNIIKSGIAKSANGLFALALLHVKDLASKPTLKALRDTVDNLSQTSSYDVVYGETMRRISDQSQEKCDLAMKILAWLTYATRPLRVSELQQILSVAHDRYEINQDDEPTVEMINSICCGLALVDNTTGTIDLFHHSTKLYLEAKLDGRLLDYMANTCFNYLRIMAFDRKVYEEQSPFFFRQPDNTLYDYLAKNWVKLARQASSKVATSDFIKHDQARLSTECLFWASRNDHRDVVTWLLDQGLDPKLQDYARRNALHHAVMHASVDSASILYKRGAPLTVDADNMTPMHYAASQDQQTIEALRGAGLPIDLRLNRLVWRPTSISGEVSYSQITSATESTARGLTPLHYAALIGNVDAVRTLLSLGADSSAKSIEGDTPLHLALEHSNHIDKGATIYSDRWSDPNYRVETVLDDIPIGNEKEYAQGQSTVSERREEIVRMLLDSMKTRVNTNAQNDRGASYLHSALRGGHMSMSTLRLLLEAGNDVSASDNQGKTALHCAIDDRNADAVRLLFENGADVNATDHEGHTVLHSAVQERNLDIVRLLLENGADVNAADHEGRTVLHLAVQEGNLDIVRLLLENGAGVNAADHEGRTVLHSAVQEGNLDIVHLLLENGADVNATDHEGRTVLHLAVQEGNLDIVRLLHKRGADVNAADHSGRTVLYFAI